MLPSAEGGAAGRGRGGGKQRSSIPHQGGSLFPQQKSDAEIDTLILKYQGHEEELFQTLCSKYGIDQRAAIARAVAMRQRSGPSVAADGSEGSSSVPIGGAAAIASSLFGAASPLPVTAGASRHGGGSVMRDTTENYGGVGVGSGGSGMSADQFVRDQFELARRTDAARRRVEQQTAAIARLVAERAELKTAAERTAAARGDEVAIITHTLTAMRIDLMRLEDRLLPATTHVPFAAYSELKASNAEVTRRLAEALKLRRLVEAAVAGGVERDPSGLLARRLAAVDPSMAVRMGVVL